MATRKEQKEALRREREAAAAAAAASERRRRLVGYGIGALLGVAAIAAAIILVSGGGEDAKSGGGNGASIYPAGGEVPARKLTDLDEAAKAAGCEVREVKVPGRNHVEKTVKYPSKPPAGGNHNPVPAEDGIYDNSPTPEALVHGLEHGRVIIWFKRRLPAEMRAKLKAFFDADSYQLFLTPDPTGMPYALAATAWNGQPEPVGTGRLLGCPKATDASFDALAAFRDEHRSNGLEPVP